MKPKLTQRIIMLVALLIFISLGTLWGIQRYNDNARQGTVVEIIERPIPTRPNPAENPKKPEQTP